MNGAHSDRPRRPWAARRFLLVAALFLALTWTAVEARYRNSGAGGCGDFIDSLTGVQDGDALSPMYDAGEGRNSGGATINQDVIIEGRWTPPSDGSGGFICPEANGVYETSTTMLTAGFTYGSSAQRSALFGFGGPVLQLDPAVKNYLMYATDFYIQQNEAVNGGGLFGTGMISATLRFEQVGFIPRPSSIASVTGNGGGLSLDIDGGSRLTIENSQFSDLAADNGGGFDLTVRGNSHVTLSGVQVTNNSANSGRGGGGRLIIHSGYVTITDSLFSGNSASVEGGALRIERVGNTGPAEVWIVNTRFTGNSAPINADISTSGSGLTVHVLNQTARLPLVTSNSTPGARIDKITRSGNTYVVEFTPVGFAPQPTGRHVHFFFDTVPPAQAGVPGSGPWYMYAGTSPFNLWGVADRPAGATRMCILVANADHSVIQGTGNCVRLP